MCAMATACHVGALNGSRRPAPLLAHPEGSHTDAKRRLRLSAGRLPRMLAHSPPVVRIEEETFGYATAEKVPATIRDFLASQHSGGCRQAGRQPPCSWQWWRRGQVCLDSCCLAKEQIGSFMPYSRAWRRME